MRFRRKSAFLEMLFVMLMFEPMSFKIHGQPENRMPLALFFAVC